MGHRILTCVADRRDGEGSPAANSHLVHGTCAASCSNGLMAVSEMGPVAAIHG